MPTSTAATRRRLPPAARARTALMALALLLWAVPTAYADVAGDVQARVARAITATAPKKATIGVQIVALGDAPGDRKVLYTRSADRPMIPASNLKLITTAAALDTLGEDFKFRTQLLVRANTSAGDVELAVVGDGDPSFGDATLLKEMDGWGTRTVFETWARVLSERGVRRVSALHLDDSVFDEEYAHPNWPADQRHKWYEAQVGGLNLNVNCLDVYLTRGSGRLMNYRLDPPTEYVTVDHSCRRGDRNAVWLTRAEGGNRIILAGQTNASEQALSVTVHGPALYFGTVFAEVLREHGIDCADPVVDRTIRAGWELQQQSAGQPDAGAEITDTPDVSEAPESQHMLAAQSMRHVPWQLLAVHQTGMGPVLARTNKDSINMYAEALSKRLGFAATGEPGSWRSGEQAIKDFLFRIGAEAQEVNLDDGSGMSRQNRVTAAVLCDVLSRMHYGEAAEAFRDSLSEAGVDGTLEQRFGNRGRDLRGRVFGKTGYINGVITFSGYLHGRDGRWYAFSILVNDCPETWKAREMQEAIVEALDNALK